jgi:Nitrile hydratase beta subunit
MAGTAALPRENGELVFDAPWQGRVLGMALAVVQQRGLDWDKFRQRLIAAIDADAARPYYESWTVALTDMVVDLGVISEEDLTRRTHSAEDLDEEDPRVRERSRVRREDRDRQPVEAAAPLGGESYAGDPDHDGGAEPESAADREGHARWASLPGVG